jgi:hypothetical protein
MQANKRLAELCGALAASSALLLAADTPPATAPAQTAEQRMRAMLDAPLLFVKRHSYTGIHIYDTFYKWPPGGGGIYVLENPSAPPAQWRIRPVIDPSTPGTPGAGVYSHPELSWDATKLLFCFKGEPQGSTSIYEIGLDGKGLRRVTDPTPSCAVYRGAHGGQHDIAPAYLPDGRIVFLSTRPSGLVPCANSGVSILHVMQRDGSDIRPISVNFVNEFDPAVLPDGRILFGRWEYVDKNALTVQSLWTVNPDGTQETALFANNMVLPEAILDARPVSGSRLIVATLAKHNSTPRGSIAFIDPCLGKNNPAAIANLEHPGDPTHDRGDSCEPWPLSEDVVIFSGRPAGSKRNVLEMMDRAGHRFTFMSDPDICIHSPMLVKPRPIPARVVETTDRNARTGRFYVQDLYEGLPAVKRGEVKWLRVLEETSRVSTSKMGGSPYNQTFLLSAALAFSVKNFLGIVPVDENGSAYFEAPAGRALFLQALDGDGRLVQSMRTFVQAAPGTTRSCIGCHEHKQSTPSNSRTSRDVLRRGPSRMQPESWGSGYLDYPSMVQPVLDRHCASCHGGEKGIAAGMDLTGGWTEHFNISYENLVSRRESQLVAWWIAGIDCMNGTAHWSCQIFPPRAHGSGAAPLAKLLMDGHGGRLPHLTRTERDLLMAWMDSNGLYHGTWDYTDHGCAVRNWKPTRDALVAEMRAAGCTRCHGDKPGNNAQPLVFENDWFNLKDPPLSRILRAPLPAGGDGLGLGLCRDRKADPARQRVRLLVKGYAHAVKPIEEFERRKIVPPDPSGRPVVSFASSGDQHYQAMLAIIRKARQVALATPRVDMPGAVRIAGASRRSVPAPVPEAMPPLRAKVDCDGVVRLSWERSARTIGLEAELHRGKQPHFAPDKDTLVTRTELFAFEDDDAETGLQHYALVFVSDKNRSQPVYASVTVPPPAPPAAPAGLRSLPVSGAARLEWEPVEGRVAGYHVYRAADGATAAQRLTTEPAREPTYADLKVEPHATYRYTVRALSIRNVESAPTAPLPVTVTLVKEPVFDAPFAQDAAAVLQSAGPLPGKLHGKARVAGRTLDVTQGGHVTYPHRDEFDLTQPFSIECRAFAEKPGRIPVLISCGYWRQAGWFLQQIGGRYRWHVAHLDCDGGKIALGRWTHLAATFDGRTARLYQDGVKVAEVSGDANLAVWPGDLHVGQYAGQPGPDMQFHGRLANLRIFHRLLSPVEIAAAATAAP